MRRMLSRDSAIFTKTNYMRAGFAHLLISAPGGRQQCSKFAGPVRVWCLIILMGVFLTLTSVLMYFVVLGFPISPILPGFCHLLRIRESVTQDGWVSVCDSRMQSLQWWWVTQYWGCLTVEISILKIWPYGDAHRRSRGGFESSEEAECNEPNVLGWTEKVGLVQGNGFIF